MHHLFQVKRDRVITMASAPDSLGEYSLLRSISDITASETGARFFQALFKNLRQALGTHGAWVTEHLPELGRLRALDFWLGDEFIEHHEYALTALEACVTTAIVYHAAARGITIRSMESRLKGDIDLQGFLGIRKDVPRGYKEIRMFVNIDYCS